MRAPTACLATLALLSLIALRPAQPTIPERVSDLERRVDALEAKAKPPKVARNPAAPITEGMTVDQVEAVLKDYGVKVKDKFKAGPEGARREDWYFDHDETWQVYKVSFLNGTVTRVTEIETAPER